MKRHTLALAVALIAVDAVRPVAASEVRGTISAITGDRQVLKAGDIVTSVPIYGLVSLEVSKLEVPGMDTARLIVNGWGRSQQGTDPTHDSSGDLSLLYLESRSGPLLVRLGRQHLVPAQGRMDLVDGVDAHLDVGGGFSGEAFVGATVNPELTDRSDDLEAGGRLALNLLPLGHPGEVGVGYLQRWQHGDTARQELGVDFYTMVAALQITGAASMSPDLQSLVEARADATYRLSDGPSLTLDAARVAPALFISRTSIFSVFNDVPHDSFGAATTYAPSPYWRLDASGDYLRLDNTYLGYRAKLAIITYREASHRSQIGVEAQRLEEGDNGYVRGRLYTGLQVQEAVRLAADFYAYVFDHGVNGIRNSTLAQVSAIYDLTRALRVAATVSGGETPWAKRQLEAMLRLTYGHDVDLSREVGP